MIERLYSTIELPLSWEQFHQLPRNAAYKYEYFDKKCWLSPRPKLYHALLDLGRSAAPVPLGPREPVSLRPLAASDWERLPPVFANAFHQVQPFASLNESDRLEGARGCLRRTRAGDDGPLIEPACFVAEAQSEAEGGDGLLGAILVTVMPEEDLTGFDSLRWKKPPPPDWLERGIGRPHLTWIFVGPWDARNGIGSALLSLAIKALQAHDYRELASTFLLGNDASMLWHWRNGFQLIAYPGSHRHIRSRTREEREQGEPPES